MSDRQEIEQLFNYLVSKCLNKFDWNDKNVCVGTSGNDEPRSILKSEKKEFDTLLLKLQKYDKSLSKTLTSNTFSEQMFNYIWQCKKEENQKVTMQDIVDNVIKPLKALKLEKRTVFHTIEGVDISSEKPITIGNFTFYNFKMHQEYLEKTYITCRDDRDKKCFYGLDKEENWVSTQIETRDFGKAMEEGVERFNRLQNVLRFFISYHSPYFDVGILNFKRFKYDDLIVFAEETKEICTKIDGDGAREKINIKDLFESYCSTGIEPNKIIENIDKIDVLSKVEKRIMNAIDLYGRAKCDYRKAIGFLEAMLSLEALFQINLSELVTKSISAEIAEACALILANSYKERVYIEKKVKKFYGIRSKIAHGASMYVDEEEYKEIMDYAWKVIINVILRTKRFKIETEEDLREHIQKLRYM